MLYTATVSLRFNQAQRHSFVHEQCTARTLIGLVGKGNVNQGAAFYVAGPTFEAPDTPTFGLMYDTL